MGLGLYLRGSCDQPPEKLLRRIADWLGEEHAEVVLRTHIGQGSDSAPTLWAALHPAEEDLELSIPERGRVLASARTSGAGPGYHAWLCERLTDFGRAFGVRWDRPSADGEGDETGYFERRDRADLERQMIGWVQTLAGQLLAREARDWTAVQVSMPADSPLYETSDVVTALGPRDREWWSAVRTDASAAQAFFSWWDPGVGADYWLGRALCLMWTDVRWRAPATDAEQAVDEAVVSMLSKAFALDPVRAYPFREWNELLGHLERKDAAVAARAATAPGPLVGYRRQPLRTRPFPGWSVKIPGSFAETYDEKGTWSAWDSGRTVWLTELTFSAPPGVTTLPEPTGPSDPALARTDEKFDARATFEPFTEDGERYLRLDGRIQLRAGPPLQILTVSIVAPADADRTWAIETWKSIRYPGR